MPPKQLTRLEKFLVLFNQAWCTDQEYILDLQNVPEEFEDIARYLQGPLMDDDFCSGNGQSIQATVPVFVYCKPITWILDTL